MPRFEVGVEAVVVVVVVVEEESREVLTDEGDGGSADVVLRGVSEVVDA